MSRISTDDFLDVEPHFYDIMVRQKHSLLSSPLLPRRKSVCSSSTNCLSLHRRLLSDNYDDVAVRSRIGWINLELLKTEVDQGDVDLLTWTHLDQPRTLGRTTYCGRRYDAGQDAVVDDLIGRTRDFTLASRRQGN